MPTSISLTRRAVLAATALTLAPRPGLAATDAGVVEATHGTAFAKGAAPRDLVADAPVFIGDQVGTGPDSRLAMMLANVTHILMGPDTSLTIDHYTAESGGELVLGQGAMLFDRDESAPKTDVSLSTAFGLIAVRGTRFFAGPSKDKFGVFVERGEVRLAAAGVEVTILPGFGSDIAKPGDPPSAPAKWKQPRIDAALKLVGA